jgi:hypothetical protein
MIEVPGNFDLIVHHIAELGFMGAYDHHAHRAIESSQVHYMKYTIHNTP